LDGIKYPVVSSDKEYWDELCKALLEKWKDCDKNAFTIKIPYTNQDHNKN
jgi:hypothetical protein